MRQPSPHRIPRLALLAQWALVLAVGMLVPIQGQAQTQETDPSSLRIFLKPEVKIANGLLRLGDVALVRGDEALAEKARQLTLGRLFVPNQKVILKRATLLSRLATLGITGRQITISGASQVSVQRDQKAISGQELTELAQTFLEKKLGGSDTLRTKALRVPQFIYIDPALKDVRLSPKLQPNTRPGLARVTITATAAGQALTTRDVTFQIEYKTSRIVAKERLMSGTLLTPENTVIEPAYAPRPQPANWKPLYGKILKRPVAAKKEITVPMVEDPSPPAPEVPPLTLEAGRPVIIQIKRPGFQVSVDGITTAAGRVGDVIRVRNIDSQRVIHCTIKEDGTVEPIL